MTSTSIQKKYIQGFQVCVMKLQHQHSPPTSSWRTALRRAVVINRICAGVQKKWGNVNFMDGR